MSQYIYLVPLFPLIGFLISSLFGKSLSKSVVSIVASLAVLCSFVIALLVFFELKGKDAASLATTVNLFEWIAAGKLSVNLSFLIDPLSSLFILIITGVGFLIHVYSIGYMHDDEGQNKFFSYLNLFVFFMLILVLGSNYLMMFVGWEGVGLCSYLLIGFWFKNNNYNAAASKAFIMNRIGDLGFLLGIFMLFQNFGSLNYSDIFNTAKSMSMSDPNIIAITLLLFVGAIGKSAQIPLYTWLPDAMAGPTPVSALIHAATMVTAGIYMIARSNILYTLAPETLETVAYVGVATALFAATIGLAQNDIKKVLAYSTVSQLGLMFVALGLGDYTSAVFHVMTHAFFKALLFLGAGSVIHAMSGEQDIRSMGGLKKSLPVTFATFFIGTWAISGLPPFSGFFSKDEILAAAFQHNKVLWVLGIAVSMMTAFYMFRLFFLTFYGSFRGTEHQKHHLHESPKTMTVPLIVLAAFSIIAGFFNLPEAIGGGTVLKSYLAPVFSDSVAKMLPSHLSHETEYMLMGLAVLTAMVSIFVARYMYITKAQVPAAEGENTSALHKVVYNKYFVDELYETLFTKPLKWASRQFHSMIESELIDGIVNGVGRFVIMMSGQLRLLQTGSTGFYVFAMVLGIIAILLTQLIAF